MPEPEIFVLKKGSEDAVALANRFLSFLTVWENGFHESGSLSLTFTRDTEGYQFRWEESGVDKGQEFREEWVACSLGDLIMQIEDEKKN